MFARELAIKTGNSEATMSRLLSGDRNPSLGLMLRIRDAIGWALEDQANCLETGRYPARLKEMMDAADVANLQAE